MRNQTDSQTQFLQLVCVVLVMTTLIGLVAAYILYRDVQNLQNEVAQTKSQTDRFKSEILRLRGDVDTLKKLSGYQFAEVGDRDSLENNTIVGKARSDIRRLAGDLPQPTLRNALVELHTRLQEVTQERNTLKKELEKTAATAQSKTR